MISPLSLQAALVMLAAGSGVNSTTRNELMGVLGADGDFETFRKQFAELLEDFKVRRYVPLPLSPLPQWSLFTKFAKNYEVEIPC